MKQYYVYIMASGAGVLYVGVTSNIKKRVWQHKQHLLSGFTDKYNVDRLVYFETMSDAGAAINREKQLKKWKRDKKVSLIDSQNSKWKDLSDGWYE